MESHDPHVLKGHGKVAGDKRIFKDRVKIYLQVNKVLMWVGLNNPF